MSNRTQTAAAAGVTVAVAAGAALVVGKLTQNTTITPANAGDAARFLTQCAFGVTDADIADVQAKGFDGWIDAQMAMTPYSMLADVTQRLDTQSPYQIDGAHAFVESFWTG